MQHLDQLLQKQLQHTSETSEILETYTCNMRFQQNLAGGALHSGIRLFGRGGEGG
jgi:uncharacterized membrane protein YebE (DUF533 family)